ncbi:MAG: hypothetical protein JWP83_1460 [Mycobacterium sp.]|jgi:hypothetical protein|nr:hypothetical protein [Mycobacterium sp.]
MTSPPASTPSSTTLDDTQKQQLLRLLVEDVHVTGWHVIRLRIVLDRHHPNHRTRPAQQANHHHRARCQPRTVCVPLVGTDGDSYRIKDAQRQTGTPDPPLNYPQGAGTFT